MRNLILIIIICILGTNMGIAFTSAETDNQLTAIEKEIKSYAGENISLNQRIENAEIIVFGEKRTGNTDTRLNELSEALGLGTINKNAAPKYEFEEEDNYTDYPVIDKLEMQVFNKTFKDNIYIRLDRLENKIYGKIISEKSLNERVSALTEKLIPNRQEISQQAETYNYYSPDTDKEKEISKAEMKYFNKKFDDEDFVTRKERIDAVEQAKKSDAEYKANKFAKYAATGLQIGGLVLLILALVL